MEPKTGKRIVREREDHEPDLYTQLCNAAVSGDAETVQRLLLWGVGLDKPRFYRTPALLCAVGAGQIKIARLLIEEDADVSAADDFGFTPLMLACRDEREEQMELVNLLLEHSADVHAINDQGETALSYAMQDGNVECARLLLEAGAE